MTFDRLNDAMRAQRYVATVGINELNIRGDIAAPRTSRALLVARETWDLERPLLATQNPRAHIPEDIFPGPRDFAYTELFDQAMYQAEANARFASTTAAPEEPDTVPDDTEDPFA